MIAATRIDESSPHYRGWRVVLACFLMAFFMFGFGLYGQGVYLAELQRAHGWPGTLISAASTFSFVLTSVLVVFTDDLLERIGLRCLILCGLSALGASTALLALMQTPWQLYLANAVLAFGWAGTSLAMITNTISLWFDHKRGMAISLALNGASFGGIVGEPYIGDSRIHRPFRKRQGKPERLAGDAGQLVAVDPTATRELNAVKDADDVSFRKKAEISSIRDKIRLHYRDRGHATPFLIQESSTPVYL